ncbi:hypothetical protein IDJ77_07835 [Mucilaginibacter sp. ZT4R22]|uniref:Uncharacterized protein n=1 Tax=Mucilaginibacter pankratovii TaxID=2772110 RepID=A0ABR7WN36_9SPHI|nr:DUF6358 family protein [Mucilaginibacter pankratovii]MBD1363717.1 hypothetical protein [Mucilaginibacter pankratovii]
MGKKIALNVVYNLGIFVALMIGYWGIEHAQYAYLLGAVFIAAVFISLKIKLIKEVKNTTGKQ